MLDLDAIAARANAAAPTRVCACADCHEAKRCRDLDAVLADTAALVARVRELEGGRVAFASTVANFIDAAVEHAEEPLAGILRAYASGLRGAP